MIEMPLGSWLLQLPEIKKVEKACFGEGAQVTDFCEYGLRDPENKLPHRRTIALLATFPLQRAKRLCSGHKGKAHQWTKGFLSKRFGGVARLGYSQRWTPMFCRDLVEVYADFVNPLKNKLASRPGTHQSQLSRSTYGSQKKVNQALVVAPDAKQTVRTAL